MLGLLLAGVVTVVIARWLRARRAGSPPPPCATHARAGATRASPASARLDAFPGDDASLRALGERTLERLVAAFPTLPAADGAGLWYEAAFARMDDMRARLERRALPPLLHDGHWRYLILTRCLFDALEQAFGVWQLIDARDEGATQPLCPLTEPFGGSAGQPVVQRRRPRRRGEMLATRAGLGSVLAGRWLPDEGRALVAEAAVKGVDWCRSERFRAVLGTTHEAPAASAPVPAFRTPEVTSATAAPEPEQPHPRSPPTKATMHASESRSSADLTGTLATALGEVIEALWHEGRLNRRDGLGWVADGQLHVVAKALAERLVAHPQLAAQAPVFQVRKRLYRALLAHGLIEARGLRPTRTITVIEAGQQQRATVVTLALAGVWPDAAGRPQAFSGELVLAPASGAAGRSTSTASAPNTPEDRPIEDTDSKSIEPATLFSEHYDK